MIRRRPITNAHRLVETVVIAEALHMAELRRHDLSEAVLTRDRAALLGDHPLRTQEWNSACVDTRARLLRTAQLVQLILDERAESGADSVSPKDEACLSATCPECEAARRPYIEHVEDGVRWWTLASRCDDCANASARAARAVHAPAPDGVTA